MKFCHTFYFLKPLSLSIIMMAYLPSMHAAGIEKSSKSSKTNHLISSPAHIEGPNHTHHRGLVWRGNLSGFANWNKVRDTQNTFTTRLNDTGIVGSFGIPVIQGLNHAWMLQGHVASNMPHHRFSLQGFYPPTFQFLGHYRHLGTKYYASGAGGVVIDLNGRREKMVKSPLMYFRLGGSCNYGTSCKVFTGLDLPTNFGNRISSNTPNQLALSDSKKKQKDDNGYCKSYDQVCSPTFRVRLGFEKWFSLFSFLPSSLTKYGDWSFFGAASAQGAGGTQKTRPRSVHNTVHSTKVEKKDTEAGDIEGIPNVLAWGFEKGLRVALSPYLKLEVNLDSHSLSLDESVFSTSSLMSKVFDGLLRIKVSGRFRGDLHKGSPVDYCLTTRARVKNLRSGTAARFDLFEEMDLDKRFLAEIKTTNEEIINKPEVKIDRRGPNNSNTFSERVLTPEVIDQPLDNGFFPEIKTKSDETIRKIEVQEDNDCTSASDEPTGQEGKSIVEENDPSPMTQEKAEESQLVLQEELPLETKVNSTPPDSSKTSSSKTERQFSSVSASTEASPKNSQSQEIEQVDKTLLNEAQVGAEASQAGAESSHAERGRRVTSRSVTSRRRSVTSRPRRSVTRRLRSLTLSPKPKEATVESHKSIEEAASNAASAPENLKKAISGFSRLCERAKAELNEESAPADLNSELKAKEAELKSAQSEVYEINQKIVSSYQKFKVTQYQKQFNSIIKAVETLAKEEEKLTQASQADLKSELKPEESELKAAESNVYKINKTILSLFQTFKEEQDNEAKKSCKEQLNEQLNLLTQAMEKFVNLKKKLARKEKWKRKRNSQRSFLLNS